MSTERAFLTAKRVRQDSFQLTLDGSPQDVEVFELSSQPRFLARWQPQGAEEGRRPRWAAATNLLVTLQPEVKEEEVEPLLRRLASPEAPEDERLRVTPLPLPGLHLVEWRSDAAPVGPEEGRGFLLSRVREIAQSAAVESAGLDLVYFKIPVEPRAQLLDALPSPESELRQMGVPEAWKHDHEGDRGIRVAVLDSGVDPAHEELLANLYKVQGKPKGWRFDGDGEDFRDDNGHGTFCAGLIGGSGGHGVNRKVSIIPVKFMNANGYGTAGAAIRGIQFALEANANVISCSWGGTDDAEKLEEMIRKAHAQGVLFVAGAGNDEQDLDDEPSFYPAAYSVPNMLSVGACDDADRPVEAWGYGRKRVHLTAPGTTVYSTTFGNGVTQGDGTSASSAFVAGACALVMAALKKSNQPWDHMTVRKRIIQSVAPLKGDGHEVEKSCCSKGRLDVWNAVSGELVDATLSCP